MVLNDFLRAIVTNSTILDQIFHLLKPTLHCLQRGYDSISASNNKVIQYIVFKELLANAIVSHSDC